MSKNNARKRRKVARMAGRASRPSWEWNKRKRTADGILQDRRRLELEGLDDGLDDEQVDAVT